MAGKISSSSNNNPYDAEAKAYCEGRKAQIDGGSLTNNPYSDNQQDIVSNGSMSSDTMWVKGTGWSIGSGIASCSGAQVADSDLNQANRGIVEGESYEITITISGYSAGTLTPVIGGQAGTARSSNNTFTEIITAGSTDTDINLRANSTFVGSIDNIIVKPLSPNGSSWRRGFADALAANPKLCCAE